MAVYGEVQSRVNHGTATATVGCYHLSSHPRVLHSVCQLRPQPLSPPPSHHPDSFSLTVPLVYTLPFTSSPTLPSYSTQVESLQRRIAPHLLRRVKEDVAKDIPPKEETIIDVELTTMQKQYYRCCSVYCVSCSIDIALRSRSTPTM
jgi:SNF2-related domain